MENCPCCSHPMLRHIRQHEVYWFCRRCWQVMPVYNLTSYHLSLSANLPTVVKLKKQPSSLVIV